METNRRFTDPVVGDCGARLVQLTVDFVLEQLASHRQHHYTSATSESTPPLFVGVQGPQGCGKSHLTAQLPSALARADASIRCATLSLDDLYLTHSDLAAVAAQNPSNGLLQGRGQPGTHDLALAEQILSSLSSINAESGRSVDLPVFDKSAYGGEGDRSPTESVRVEGPIDVVIFEGWALGFASLPATELHDRYRRAQADPAAFAKEAGLDYDRPSFLEHSESSLAQLNSSLREYEERLWNRVDCFVQLVPAHMTYVWQWRLEQEHNMKRHNGGVGMTDAQVRAFIGRYMPGYELFLKGVQDPATPWAGRGVAFEVGRERQILGFSRF